LTHDLRITAKAGIPTFIGMTKWRRWCPRTARF